MLRGAGGQEEQYSTQGKHQKSRSLIYERLKLKRDNISKVTFATINSVCFKEKKIVESIVAPSGLCDRTVDMYRIRLTMELSVSQSPSKPLPVNWVMTRGGEEISLSWWSVWATAPPHQLGVSSNKFTSLKYWQQDQRGHKMRDKADLTFVIHSLLLHVTYNSYRRSHC